MPATGNEAVRLSQLKSWWDTTIATINASIANKLDKPGTAATAGQVLSNNGTQNVWIDAPGGDSYVLPPASEESLGGVTLATGKAGHSGVVGNGTDELIVQNPVGKTSGAVMTVDDAYPTKPLELKVYGNTRQNLWSNPSGSDAGVTVTANEDGSITLSGTATANVFIYLSSYVFSPGSTHCLSCGGTIQNGVEFYIEHAADSHVGLNHDTNERMFTTKSSFDVPPTFGISVASGTAVSGTYRIMLNEGSTAQPWCPPGLNSVSELEYVFEDDEEPPNVTTTPIDLQGNELCSLPDGTRDELDVVTGEIEKKTALVSGLKAKDVSGPAVTGSGAYRYFIENVVPGGMPYSARKKDGMCDALTYDADFTTMKANTCYVQNNNLFVACDKQTVEEFKIWFDALNLSIVYKLAEPKSLQLVPPELPALPSPNVTAYASASVEAESEMEYVQLLNVVLSKLSSGGQRLYKGTT